MRICKVCMGMRTTDHMRTIGMQTSSMMKVRTGRVANQITSSTGSGPGSIVATTTSRMPILKPLRVHNGSRWWRRAFAAGWNSIGGRPVASHRRGDSTL